jgi:hypothetical protein
MHAPRTSFQVDLCKAIPTRILCLRWSWSLEPKAGGRNTEITTTLVVDTNIEELKTEYCYTPASEYRHTLR